MQKLTQSHSLKYQEWSSSTSGNILLQTNSDTAAKLYDACTEQFLGWYDEISLGGLLNSIDKMVEADPGFIIGKAFELNLHLLGGMMSPLNGSEQLTAMLENLNFLVEKNQHVSAHSKLHVELTNKLGANKLREASIISEQIATLYPHDIANLKMIQTINFCIGDSFPLRNSTAYALSRFAESSNPRKNPQAGYAHGLMSFAFEESNQFALGQEEALKALSLIPHDTWAIHNYAHCLEMQAKSKEGLKWMLDKKCDWYKCEGLSSHQNWHTALFMINQDDDVTSNINNAVSILEDEIFKYCTSNDISIMALHDVASMIYRMDLADIIKTSSLLSKQRNKTAVKKVYNVCKDHRKDHLLGFNDAHYMMILLGMDDLESAQELINSIDETSTMPEALTVVKPLLQAMLNFKNGNYDSCSELLASIRFEIHKIGGSHAQRDVFEQLLLVSSLKSSSAENKALGKRLLDERNTFQGRQTRQTTLLVQAAA